MRLSYLRKMMGVGREEHQRPWHVQSGSRSAAQPVFLRHSPQLSSLAQEALDEVVDHGIAYPSEPARRAPAGTCLSAPKITQRAARRRSPTSCRSCRSRAPRSTAPITPPATSAIRRTAAASAPALRKWTCATLPSKRVLVLVDGRRWVKGSSGSGVSGAVDLNSIPANAIKSIEILQDGASADLWLGCDRRRAEHHHGRRLRHVQDLRLRRAVWRRRRRDRRVRHAHGCEGRARPRRSLDISYTNQKEVNTADRPTSEYPDSGLPFGVSSGTPSGPLRVLRSDCDPRFLTNDTVSLTADNTSPVYIPGDPNNADASLGGADDFHHFELDDRFNYQPYNHLVTPNERINVFAKGEYDISGQRQIPWRSRASTIASRRARAAPVPLVLRPWTAARRLTWSTIFMPADHPYNPFGIDLDGSDATTGNGQ